MPALLPRAHRFGKKLADDQLQLVVKSEVAQNPLFLVQLTCAHSLTHLTHRLLVYLKRHTHAYINVICILKKYHH